MKFASLESGSEGNSLLISTASISLSVVTPKATTTVMLDCGFGIKETEHRLIKRGVSPADLSVIVVTHEIRIILAGYSNFPGGMGYL